MSALLQLRIRRNGVRAEMRRRGKPVWAGEAAFESPAELVEVIAGLAGEASLPGRPERLQVTIEASLVQVRSLNDLPPVPRAALRALVANQAGRFFRRNGSPLVTDAIWAGGGGGKRRVAIAAAVEEPWLDAIAVGAEAAGLRLVAISPAEPAAFLELLPTSERARRVRCDRLLLKRLALLAAALWLIAGALLVARVRWERGRIERELAELQQPAAALLGLRRELGEARLMVETVERAERERGVILRRIAGILLALPDSAHLTSVTLDQRGRGSLTGAAPQAAGVVASLDRAEAVAGPRMAGPAVREVIARSELERFTITFGPAGTE